MPVNYNPEDAVTTWPGGDYDAVLLSVTDGTSKTSGNPMQTLVWEVYHPDGRKQAIKDYIVVPSQVFKLKQLAKALGCEAQFDAGEFQADDHVGRNVTAVLTTESQEGYDDKNKVARVKPATAPAVGPKADEATPRVKFPRTQGRAVIPAGARDDFPANGELKEDDIPF